MKLLPVGLCLLHSATSVSTVDTNTTTVSDEISALIGATCAINNDCSNSTFCCSQGVCVPGNICY